MRSLKIKLEVIFQWLDYSHIDGLAIYVYKGAKIIKLTNVLSKNQTFDRPNWKFLRKRNICF